MDAASRTESRKSEHIRINLEEDVRSKGVSTGLERYRLPHVALPELALSEVDLSTSFLGRSLRAPILVSCMTGGVSQGHEINHRLALAAEAMGCAIGVGSQRAAVENPELERFFQLRDAAPSALVLANLGAVQLNYGYGVEQCRRAVESIQADALVLHFNPLQEALQAEGDTNFAGLLRKIEAVCSALEAPVVVKEVGWGISGAVARQLVSVGVAGIDVAGAGGTSWSEVERHRAPTTLLRRVSGTFAGWGIPTAECVREVRSVLPHTPLIASGGMLTGVDAAKAIALGANLVGFASPLLRAAAQSEEAAHELLRALVDELRISMFCTGTRTISDLQHLRLLPAEGQLAPPE